MLATRIEPTSSHHLTTPVQQRFPAQRSLHRQDKSRGDFFDEMTGLDQRTMQIAPTAHNGEPMLKDQTDELGPHLTENAHGLLAAPDIEASPLFPQFPDQFDLPACSHQFAGLLRAEPILWHIGEQDQPIFDRSSFGTRRLETTHFLLACLFESHLDRVVYPFAPRRLSAGFV